MAAKLKGTCTRAFVLFCVPVPLPYFAVAHLDPSAKASRTDRSEQVEGKLACFDTDGFHAALQAFAAGKEPPPL